MNLLPYSTRDSELHSFLDLNKTNSKTQFFKGSGCGYLSLVKGQQDSTKVLRVLCKKRDCPICGPKLQAFYYFRILKIAKERNLNIFVTLTLDPKKVKLEDSFKAIKKIWNKWRIYEKKYREGVNSDYVYVVEFQKNGYPHIHALLSHKVDFKFLQETWEKLGGGRFVNIKEANSVTTSYLCKYLQKNFADTSAPKRFRRVCASRSIRLRMPKEPSGFEFKNIPYEDLADLYRGGGIPINDKKGNELGFITKKRLSFWEDR